MRMVGLFLLLSAATVALSTAFTTVPIDSRISNANLPTYLCMSTIVEPRPITETERRSKGSKRERNVIPPGQGEVRGPLEWLIDDDEISRDDDDPFHILLLSATFEQNNRITIEYVASSCSYVLGMPFDDAAELARHAKAEGFSCLGTWSHAECLRLGGLLQQRDIVCRVVPFCEGGDRPWQARDASVDDEVIEVSGDKFA
ncbi:hypothetical protein ACHAW6_001926 [Cyclotella cf. meneghiniana]